MNRNELAHDHFADQFAQFEMRLDEADPAWLAPIRRAAIERFCELGLPTRSDEAWKYTSAASIANAGFRPVESGSGTVSREDIARLFGNEAAIGLVFENGQLVEDLCSTDALPDGVVATGLSRLLCEEPEQARKLIAHTVGSLSRPFSALNLAFQSDGAVVRIASTLDQPLELLFVHTPEAAGRFANPRNWIALEAGVSATVTMRYASLATLETVDDAYLTNAATSISLGAGAQLDLVSVQQEAEGAIHLASIDVEQQRDSNFRSHLISLGAQLARNEVNSRLSAPGASCTLNGLFLADGTQHLDNQTLIDHASPHGTSRELYKGICGGRSRGVFNGMVRVRPDAQKTNAEQSNPNLLTSDRAQINAKPTLEIYANDVKCSHGSTIGRLDEDALFYLRTRGISERDARRILAVAFAAEIADAIPCKALRDFIQRQINAKLQRSAAKEAA